MAASDIISHPLFFWPQGMAHIPGWGEKNFQVMAKQFEVIKCLATDAQTLTRRDGFVAINGLVEKVR